MNEQTLKDILNKQTVGKDIMMIANGEKLVLKSDALLAMKEAVNAMVDECAETVEYKEHNESHGNDCNTIANDMGDVYCISKESILKNKIA